MKWNKILKTILTATLTVILLRQAAPALALGASTGGFYANCGNFSAEVTVTGTTDDGGGYDNFRYKIVDGANHLLYQEDARRQVGVTVSSTVVNLHYNTGAAPTVNPILLTVVDTYGNGVEKNVIVDMTYDAPCLAPSNHADHHGSFIIHYKVSAIIQARPSAPLWEYPGINQLNLVVKYGEVHPLIYHWPGGTWYAISDDGNELVWVPASTVKATGDTTIPPTRIDGSGLAPGQDEANAAGSMALYIGQPVPGSVAASAPNQTTVTGITATASTLLNLRSGPGRRDPVIGTVPARATVSVLGRDKSGIRLKVEYKGQTGWIYRAYVRMLVTAFRRLPVVS